MGGYHIIWIHCGVTIFYNIKRRAVKRRRKVVREDCSYIIRDRDKNELARKPYIFTIHVDIYKCIIYGVLRAPVRDLCTGLRKVNPGFQ